MDKKIKAKWVKALRSGAYSQTTGALVNRQGTAFCCLGVLCNIHAEETGGEWVFDELEIPKYRGAEYSLPRAVSQWAGLGYATNPVIEGTSLSDWNDDEGARFKEIADLIEKNL